MKSMLRPSRRASQAAEAVVERILGKYLRPGVINLAPGSVRWAPPSELLSREPAGAVREDHRYGACHGDPELLASLRAKLQRENGFDMSGREVRLARYLGDARTLCCERASCERANGCPTRTCGLQVMVTPGANQAYAAALLAVCDPGDEVVLFAPYYFSHLVAIQLLGLTPVVLPGGEGARPDPLALRAALSRPGSRVRAVTLVNPGNPSGALCEPARTAALLRECAAGGAWLLSDEAYEHVVHADADAGGDAAPPGGGARRGPSFASAGGAQCEPGLVDGVVALHTLSKSFGLAGWRVGYLSYPASLHTPLLKVQDTLPTHAARYSQRLARRCLDELGTPWVREQVRALQPARQQLWHAAMPLYQHAEESLGAVARAEQPAGAFYYLLPLPASVDEEEAISLLAKQHGLLLLPGSAFGAPGVLRLSYGSLADEEVGLAAARLSDGVQDLLRLSASR
jgi:aspartate/methionine/tyrosine aminotransferase